MVIRMAIRISAVVVSTVISSPAGVISFLGRLVFGGVTTSTTVPVVVAIVRVTTIIATIMPFVDVLISVSFGSGFRFLFIDGSSSTPVSVSVVAVGVVIVAVVSAVIPIVDALVRRNLYVGAEIRFRFLVNSSGQSQQRGQ